MAEMVTTVLYQQQDRLYHDDEVTEQRGSRATYDANLIITSSKKLKQETQLDRRTKIYKRM